ncbi:MAG: DNA alkylation repair protein [Planctomycetota bacterium]
MLTNKDDVLSRVRELASPEFIITMSRFGIRTAEAVGVSVTELRKLSASIAPSNELACQLWETGIHEARLLATMVAVPSCFSSSKADEWVEDIDSWDICDMACNNLFRRTEFAAEKVVSWSADSREFVRRCGFALIAVMAAHRKHHGEAPFLQWLHLVKEHSVDERPMVKKAVNWALREVGKRSAAYWTAAVQVADELKNSGNRAARWIGSDAYRELTSEAVRKKLGLP